MELRRGLAAVQFSILARRQADGIAKNTREIGLRSETETECNVHQRGPREGQLLLRPLDAQLGDKAMWRKHRGVTEQSGEVEGAEACLRSEILKPYARPQLRLDIVEHPFHPVRIERWRSRRRSPTVNRIVSKKMRRQSHLQPIHEK